MQKGDNGCCNKRLVLGVLGCFGGCFIHLVIGSMYQWGIISIYVTSFYRLQDSSVTLEANAVAFPAMMLCLGTTMKMGIYLSEKTHPLIVMAFAIVCQSICVFSSSYLPSMTGFIIVYGCLIGLFSGLNFMITIFECNKYFPGKKMYVNAVVLTGTGLGSVVFGLFSYNFLNPNKVPPIKGYYIGSEQLQNIAANVPQCLRWLSLLYLGFGLMGVLMISYVCIDNRRKENEKKQAVQNQAKIQQQLNQQTKNENNTNAPQNKDQYADTSAPLHKEPETSNIFILSPVSTVYAAAVINTSPAAVIFPTEIKQIICTRVFWLKIFIMFFGSCGLFLFNGNYKTYVKATIHDDNLLTVIGVIGSLGNGFSRFFWNLLFNYTGYRFVITLNLIIQIIIFSIIKFTVVNSGAYLFLILLNGICIGGFLVSAPTFLQIVFGQVIGSNSYGIFWTAFGLSNFLQYAFVSGLSPIITFDGVIYICLGMSVIALAIVTFGNFVGPWNNPTTELGYFSHCNKQKQQNK